MDEEKEVYKLASHWAKIQLEALEKQLDKIVSPTVTEESVSEKP